MKDVKIVVLDGDCANPGDLDWDAFRAIGEVEVFPYTAAGEVVKRATGADVLIDNKVELTAGILDALQRYTTDHPWIPPYFEVDALVALLRRVFGIATAIAGNELQLRNWNKEFSLVGVINA